jgi:hypothetical protein
MSTLILFGLIGFCTGLVVMTIFIRFCVTVDDRQSFRGYE